MSIQVLQGKMTHEARHDLESFFWLLLYIVLRHTDHSLQSDPRALRSIFGAADDQTTDCKRRKQSHLAFDEPVSVFKNDEIGRAHV